MTFFPIGYSIVFTSGLEIELYPHFGPKMSSLGLLEPKIIPKQRTTGNYCHGCYFCDLGNGLVVGGGTLLVGGGSFYGDWGVFALMMDFREVMLTLPPETG